MEGGGKFNRKEIESLLANIDKRVFLLHNVNEEHPQMFYTRWAMSYLRGPLTRTQIKQLVKVDGIKTDFHKPTQTVKIESVKPDLPKNIKPLFLKRDLDESMLQEYSYKPCLAAVADVRFYDRTKKIDFEKSVSFIVPITDEIISVKWDEAIEIQPDDSIFKKQQHLDIAYSALPAAASDSKNFSEWERFFVDHLISDYYIEVYHSPSLKVTSEPNEDVRNFKIRLGHMVREQRDEEVDKIKERFARRIQTLEGRMHRAQERIERERSQSSQQKISTAISIGSTILGALFGRKSVSSSTISKAGTAIRSAGKVMKESGDINRSQENLERLNRQMSELQYKLQDETDMIQDKFDMSIEQLETLKIRPAKTRISIKLFSFLWVPTSNEQLAQIEEFQLV